MKQIKKPLLLLILFFLFPLCSSGCSSRTQLEDRNFVMALGIETVGENYRFTFQMPNFGVSTGQNDKEESQDTITLDGSSMADIEGKFELQSEKKLDYNHMKAIILHDQLTENEGKIRPLLAQFQERNEFGRNTALYVCKLSPEYLLREGRKEEDLGSYLEKLRRNKDSGRTNRQVTIGNYITCSNNTLQSITVPSLSFQDGTVKQTGGAIITGATLRKSIAEEEYQLLDLISGKGSGWQLALDPAHQLRINRLVISEQYKRTDGLPIYILTIKGRAEIIAGDDWDMEEYNQRLTTSLQTQLSNYTKNDKLDYLNLYRESGVKNRSTWIQYQGKESEYLADLKLNVSCSLQ